METVDEIIERVGPEAFVEAAQRAWAAAATLGYQHAPPSRPDEATRQRDWDTLYDAASAAMTLDGSGHARVVLAFEIYRRAPSYTVLSRIDDVFWTSLPADGRRAFWDEVRALLSQQDDRLARPVEYMLWCDVFEEPERVEAAWTELTDGDPPPRLLERVLPNTGPVPYALKKPLYDRLLSDPGWHPLIYRSLLHSAFDVYGKVDVDQALSLLDHLDLPSHQMEHRGALLERLRSRKD
ncbi:MAG: hypothetical protein AAFQ43_09675 [Bacteroidota bacterium]